MKTQFTNSFLRISPFFFAVLFILGLYSCSESARQFKEPRINYDSLAISLPKSDTLTTISRQIIDTNFEFKYIVNALYPELIHFDNEMIQKKVNYTILSNIREIIQVFAIEQETPDEGLTDEEMGIEPRDSSYKSTLDITYSIENNSKEIYSIIIACDQYNLGAMHNIPFHRTLNFNMKSGELIDLASYEALLQNSLLLNNISISAFERTMPIITYNDTPMDSTWVAEGTSPLWENFRNYNITKDSLIITFEVYQVTSFSEGPIRVGIPWSEILDQDHFYSEPSENE